MANRFLVSEGVPFRYDTKSRKIFRLEGDKEVDISKNPGSSRIVMRSREISEGKARELAKSMAADLK